MYNADGEFAREVEEEKTVEELSELLSKYQAKKYPWWSVVLTVLTVAVAALILNMLLDFGKERSKVMLMMSDPMEMMLEEGQFENSAERRFKSEPTHKGYFMQYALDAYSNDDLSSEEMLAMADEVDPENALYHYLAAGRISKEVVEKVRASSGSSLSKKEKFNQVTEYKILDQDAYVKALGQMKEAGRKRGITDHTFKIRMDKLNDARDRYPQDFIGRAVTIAEAFGVSFYSIKLLDLSRLLSAKFYELSKNGTEEEVRFWKDEYLKLIDTQLDGNGVLIDMLVVKAMVTGPLPNMRAAAAHAGMDAEVEKMTAVLDVFFQEKEAVKRKRALSRGERENKTEYSKVSYLNELADGPTMNHLPPQAEINNPGASPRATLDFLVPRKRGSVVSFKF